VAYRIEPHEASGSALQRIAVEEVEQALQLLRSEDSSLDERVHEARKHLKKLRAVLALAEGSTDNADTLRQKKTVRRAARALAPLRSEAALLESFEGLDRAFPGRVEDAAAAKIREVLAPRISSAPPAENGLHEAEALLVRAQESLARSRFRGSRWSSLESGFRHTYARARDAYARAVDRPCPETLHEFRTPAKRHLYQVHLLESLWPELLNAHRKELARIGDLLGEHHDLALLAAELRERELDADTAAQVTPLLSERSRELETQLFALGGRLFAERPRALARRFGAYFEREWERS
jgi:CHAD domain-containing protein